MPTATRRRDYEQAVAKSVPVVGARKNNVKRLTPHLGSRLAEHARREFHVVVPPGDTLEEALDPAYLYLLKHAYVPAAENGKAFPDSRHTEVILLGDDGEGGLRFHIRLVILGLDEAAMELRYYVLHKRVFGEDRDRELEHALELSREKHEAFVQKVNAARRQEGKPDIES